MSENAYDFAEETADCESAEDFLDHFGILFEPTVVRVSRLHILQRFHDYLGVHVKAGAGSRDDYRGWLTRAYQDFVTSDALTEKVFRVHQRAAGIAKVSVAAIGRAKS
jgi:nitrogenase-stabilizing/protective protein